jgi:hypothetical protein
MSAPERFCLFDASFFELRSGKLHYDDTVYSADLAAEPGMSLCVRADIHEAALATARREARDAALRECIEIAEHFGTPFADTPDRAAFRGMVASLIVEGIEALLSEGNA